MRFFVAAVGALCALGLSVLANEQDPSVPAHVRQLVVVVASQAYSHEAVVRVFSREAGSAWQPDAEAWPAAIGKNGTAWGRGLHPRQKGAQKVEGDDRSAAGRFRIGTIYGIAPALPKDARGWPYVQKGPRDAWIDDPKLPGYNHFIRIPEGEPLPDWFESQRMHVENKLFEWTVHIEHNYPDAVPGKGSAVFFHKWRGADVGTSACVSLPLERLLDLIAWLDPAKNAQLVLLSREDYLRLRQSWGLPEPSSLGL
ncbi:MAG: L,D-transpeptidase family protein [Elusimicrobiota bacterium]|jgi:L,D-peptidoglycan transpeptidase YkuD (ErfK/YbiS/YcfS/YnhG family)